MYGLLLAVVIAPDVQRLGADEFDAREAAEDRLRLWAWAFPFEFAGFRDRCDDPEILHRLRRLSRRPDAVYSRLWELRLLCSGDMPAEFWSRENRVRVWELVERLSVCTQWPVGSVGEWDANAVWRINPERDFYRDRVTTGQKVPSIPDGCNLALANVRAQLAERLRGP